MATSTEQINQLIQGYTDLKVFFEGERAAIETARSDLVGTVKAQMEFSGSVDPNNPDVNPSDGGVFASIADVVAASPHGATVEITLMAGEVYTLGQVVDIENRCVRFRKLGAAANPIIRPTAYVQAELNYSYYFLVRGGEIFFDGVDIDVSGAKADINLPWSPGRASIVTFQRGSSVRVAMNRGTLFGDGGRGLVSISGGTSAIISLNEATFDGACYVAVNASNGAAVIGRYAVTLSNGAAIADGGVLGQNLIYN